MRLFIPGILCGVLSLSAAQSECPLASAAAADTLANDPAILPDSPLREIFSRNAPRVRKILEKVTPQRKKRLLEEAENLTPLQIALYQAQFSTSDDPTQITPLRDHTQKHTKSATQRLPESAATALFTGALDSQHWTGVVIEQNYTAHQRDGLINPERHENLQRMLKGRAPIGPDERPVNLHHQTQQDPGVLVEISATQHTINSGIWHDAKKSIGARARFTAFRRMYWKKRGEILAQKRLTELEGKSRNAHEQAEYEKLKATLSHP